MRAFFVPLQRRTDVTDQSRSYGVSLLNDSKYGFSYQQDVIRMSLIRGPHRGYPSMPDSWSDQADDLIVGIHHVKYAGGAYIAVLAMCAGVWVIDRRYRSVKNTLTFRATGCRLLKCFWPGVGHSFRPEKEKRCLPQFQPDPAPGVVLTN